MGVSPQMSIYRKLRLSLVSHSQSTRYAFILRMHVCEDYPNVIRFDSSPGSMRTKHKNNFMLFKASLHCFCALTYQRHCALCIFKEEFQLTVSHKTLWSI